MAKLIAGAIEKEVKMSALVGFFIRILRLFEPLAKKAFGSLIYEGLEEFEFSYLYRQYKVSSHFRV
jgi:hypothetical protein